MLLFASTCCLCVQGIWQWWSGCRLQIRKKKTHEKAAPLRIMVVLIFEKNKNCNEYSIKQGIDGFQTWQRWTLYQSFYFFNFVFFCAWNTALLALIVRLQLPMKNIKKRQLHWAHYIFTPARNLSGTAEANILTLLCDFCNNSQLLSYVHQWDIIRKLFHCAFFEILVICGTIGELKQGKNLKSRVVKTKAMGMFKNVQKIYKHVGKFIWHRKYCQDPKIIKIFLKKLCKFFAKYKNKFVDL